MSTKLNIKKKGGFKASSSPIYATGTNKTRKRGGSKNARIKVTTPTNVDVSAHDYKLGDHIRLNDLREGYIRYIGQTSFSKHILYGIELDDKYDGKHSGIYRGRKYFDCDKPGKGIFVSINKISANTNSLNLNTTHGFMRSRKHGRKLSAMIYRNTGTNKSRVSFVVPDLSSLMLSPTNSYDPDDDNASVTSDTSTGSGVGFGDVKIGFSALINRYASDMGGIDEEEEHKYPNNLTLTPNISDNNSNYSPSLTIDDDNKDNLSPNPNPNTNPDASVLQLKLTPTGTKNLQSALKLKLRRIKRKAKKYKNAIGIKIPFGKLNSKCMSIILSFLTIRELSEYSFVSLSARDSIRLVALYDFRYMLYDVLSIQQVRKILCILKFHKPKELILPMAYFIYDPVILRLFLQFFNVNADKKDKNRYHLYKYIHKLVIDDRDIRPSSWLMRPGNYPWNELCDRDTATQDTIFPFELVECFQSLGINLWELDIRYTVNVELSYFMKSCESILYLLINAENRFDVEKFINITNLTIQNKNRTWEEIERSELYEWKSCFIHLINLNIINQRFEASQLDLYSCITHLPSLKKFYISNCHFNENTQFESIKYMKSKTNLNNRINTFIIKKQILSRVTFTIISTFFIKINKLQIIDCKLKNILYDFNFFKPMTHLTNISITNLKPKKRPKKKHKFVYNNFLKSVFDKITKHIPVCPVIIECNLLKSQIKFESHISCKLCKQLVDKRFMNDHLNIICPEKAVRCPLCNGCVKRKSLSYHWEYNCREYYTKCFLCDKLFTVNTKYLLSNHVLRHSMDLDEEAGKYEMIFIDNPQAIKLSNEYPVYTIAKCKKCDNRCICPVVQKKYIKQLIPKQCDKCINWNKKSLKKIDKPRTKGKRLSVMKKSKGKKVLIHPYPKNVKLKPIPKKK